MQVSVPNSEDCGVLTGYVVITQWRDNDGDEWLMTTAGDINDQGDMVVLLTLAPFVRFEGLGTWAIEDMIQNTVGHWYPFNYSTGRINGARLIAARNPGASPPRPSRRRPPADAPVQPRSACTRTLAPSIISGRSPPARISRAPMSMYLFISGVL